MSPDELITVLQIVASAGLILLVPVLLLITARVGRQSMRRLATRLPGFVLLEGPDPTIEGRCDGRRARVTLGTDRGTGPRGAWTGLMYRVEVPTAKDIVLERAADARAWARTGAHGQEALAAIDHLFGVGVERLAVQDGWLVARRAVSNYALAPQRVTAVLEALERLAPLFERRSLTIRVQGAEREGLAWAVGEQLLCPFCRDDLKGDDLAPCDACGTVHHAECLTEGGGCSVFACAGRRGGGPERVRAPSAMG